MHIAPLDAVDPSSRTHQHQGKHTKALHLTKAEGRLCLSLHRERTWKLKTKAGSTAYDTQHPTRQEVESMCPETSPGAPEEEVWDLVDSA